MRDEESEIVAATHDLNDSLERTRAVWRRTGWDRTDVTRMERASDRIKTLSLGIRSDDGRGASTVERHQEFEEAERQFVTTVDAITNSAVRSCSPRTRKCRTRTGASST